MIHFAWQKHRFPLDWVGNLVAPGAVTSPNPKSEQHHIYLDYKAMTQKDFCPR